MFYRRSVGIGKLLVGDDALIIGFGKTSCRRPAGGGVPHPGLSPGREETNCSQTVSLLGTNTTDPVRCPSVVQNWLTLLVACNGVGNDC